MRLILGVLAVICGLSGCGSNDRGQVQRSTDRSWFEIARTPDIVAYVDTSRIEHVDSSTSRVWLRFVYTTPLQIGNDTTQRLKATEVRDEIDCRAQRAKDLEMGLETENGITSRSPTPESGWKSFREHPLGDGVFLVACRAAGSMVRVSGGA